VMVLCIGLQKRSHINIMMAKASGSKSRERNFARERLLLRLPGKYRPYLEFDKHALDM
jgi:hypothetical protein